jgi:PAS domain S-box-containing protein
MTDGAESRVERQLAETERLSGVGSWEWEPATGRVWWSNELYRIFGLEPAQFTPSYAGYLERVFYEDRERVQGLIDAALEKREPIEYEARIVRSDGELRVIDARGRVLIDGKGFVSVVVGTVQDVTERRRSEEELRRVRLELERHARDLERSNLELEQFAYDASHDLGEPLRIMSQFATRLAREHGDKLDDEGRRLVTGIVDGAERAQMLISDLLDYARAARDPFERAWVACGREFEETVDLLAETIAERGATVTAGELPTIEAHPVQFRQLMQNLIANALRFGSAVPLEVRVEADRENGAWRFTVADNGIGIDPAHAERVFELFRRLKPKDMQAGTGIGLSICKKIVERHGGRIWVEPRPGGGSVFNFTITDRQIGMVTAFAGSVERRD